MLTKYQQIDRLSLPTEGLKRSSAFFLTKSGRIMKRVQIALPTGKIDAVVPPKDWELDDLLSESPNLSQPEILEQSLPKIPWDDPDGGVIQAWYYFAAVYNKQHSEAFVWWHWDADARKYLMVVPAFYLATESGLEYPPHSRRYCHSCRVALYDGHDQCPHCAEHGDIRPLFVLGTSHSHGMMTPFHSAGDHANELDVTGFHLTFGRLQHGPVVHMEGSFVVADGHTRFQTTWHDHFQFASTDESADRLDLWLTLIGRRESGGWVVTDDQGQTLFTGSKERCEYWAAGVRNREVRIKQQPVANCVPRAFGSGRSLELASSRTGKSRSRSLVDAQVSKTALRKTKDTKPTSVPSPARVEKFREILKLLKVEWHVLAARYAIELVTHYVADHTTGDFRCPGIEDVLPPLDDTLTIVLDTTACRGSNVVLWADTVYDWFMDVIPATAGPIRSENVLEALAAIEGVLLEDFGLPYADTVNEVADFLHNYLEEASITQ